MGDEDDGVPSGFSFWRKESTSRPGPGVQRAGGLVGQDDRRIPGQRPGDGDPLLLAAGELAGQVFRLVRQPTRSRASVRAACRRRPRRPVRRRAGELHVLQHVQLGDEVVLLEDEAQHLVADLRLLVVVHGGHIDAPSR